MPAKKNKRGDRGSTEDENRASKKPNMAATDQTTAIDEAIKKFGENEEEPSLYEIKELLVAINSSLSSILSENQALRKEIEELKGNIKFQRRRAERSQRVITDDQKRKQSIKEHLSFYKSTA